MKKITLCTLLFVYSLGLSAQQVNCYRLQLADKAGTPFTIDNPSQFLTQRAIDKRIRFEIPITEEDLPISPSYIQTIKNVNSQIAVLAHSKWFNTVTIFCPQQYLTTIQNLPFVVNILPVAKLDFYGQGKSFTTETPALTNEINVQPIANSQKSVDDFFDYGAGYGQIAMHNGQYLHNQGFRGEDMLIAVIDAGWNNFNTISVFQRLYNNGQIKGVRDLIPYINNVFAGHGHGTAVTSTIASLENGIFVGTAPNADFFFIRSEHPYTEQLIEEDFWAYAAEIADSLGVDVINSSLGYTTFPDFPQGDWTYAQMDGTASIASLAAFKATLKGVVVCVSAGNSGGEGDFHYISHPADALNVLAVAALYPDSTLAYFSSRGPSYDGRVKPDVSATGALAVGYTEDGGLNYIFGTSFASPITAGVAACLWQSLPHLTAVQLMQIMRENAHIYANPNDDFGYGIPDVYKAFLAGSTQVESHTPSQHIIPFPNPTQDVFYLSNEYREVSKVILYDLNGQVVKTVIPNSDSLIEVVVAELYTGIYFGEVIAKKSTSKFKIVKL
ncbi:MAG: S8 family peptidase [Bacteroidales bacterium]|jgi:subtilisin family serine protease|nr:S8 family peptidase [Bacteroidales bacterium]